MARSRFLFAPFASGDVPFGFFAEQLIDDSDFRADLQRLAELEAPEFAALAETLASHPTFLNRGDLERIVTSTAPSGGRGLAALIGRLSTMMRDSSDTVDEAIQSLLTLVSEHKELKSNARVLEERLPALVVHPRGLAKQKKAETLADATGYELNDFAIVCDVRPIFDDDRKSVEGAIALTTLRIEHREPDGRLAAIECRLTEQQLERLCKASDAATKKLAAIKELLEQKRIPLARVGQTRGKE